MRIAKVLHYLTQDASLHYADATSLRTVERSVSNDLPNIKNL